VPARKDDPMTDKQRTVAIIGASSDRSKWGNKSVRAHLKCGWKVFPINPKETEIEGLRVYQSLLEIPEKIDRISVYVLPHVSTTMLGDFKKINPTEVYFNPGTESPELLEKAQALGLNIIAACSIVALGERGTDY